MSTYSFAVEHFTHVPDVRGGQGKKAWMSFGDRFGRCEFDGTAVEYAEFLRDRYTAAGVTESTRHPLRVCVWEGIVDFAAHPEPDAMIVIREKTAPPAVIRGRAVQA